MFVLSANHARRGCGGRREIVLVVEGALYACPWGALRGGPESEPLCERYALLVSPALRPLKPQRHLRTKPHHEHGMSQLHIFFLSSTKETHNYLLNTYKSCLFKPLLCKLQFLINFKIVLAKN